jgi:hypothetical protein
MPIVTEKQPGKFGWVLPLVVAGILIFAVSSFMKTLGHEVGKLNQALNPGESEKPK